MFLQHITDDENVSCEQRLRQLTARLGMESPA